MRAPKISRADGALAAQLQSRCGLIIESGTNKAFRIRLGISFKCESET